MRGYLLALLQIFVLFFTIFFPLNNNKVFAKNLNPITLILDSTEQFGLHPFLQNQGDHYDILKSIQTLGLPYQIKENQILIQSVGIALSKSKAKNFNEELRNRLQQFALFLTRHSAPLKGIKWDEDFNTIEQLPLNLPPISSDSESYELLKEYALTDYGAMAIRKILEDSSQALENNYIQTDGTITSKGKEALRSQKWNGLFVFGSTDGQISAGLNSLRLPNHYVESFFPVGSEPIDRLALIHHEFGHTRFGLLSKVSMKYLNILENDQLILERAAVQRYENPVRVLNSMYYQTTQWKERTVYFDNNNTIHIPSGLVFSGPAFIKNTTLIPTAYLYKYTIEDGVIRISRDANGKGIVNFNKEAHFYKVLSPSFSF